MADEKTSNAQGAAANAKPAAPAGEKARPKKEKPPAVEDKPFTEFIQEHFLPSLQGALKKQGLEDVQLEFNKRQLNVPGADSNDYWQVLGRWKEGQRQFNVAFLKEDISGPKLFYYADSGTRPSTIEQFMGDERKITLDLMVLYTLQRLNGQKWLTRN